MVAPKVEDRTPFAAVEPKPPDLHSPGELSKPDKGDHIFGDIFGTIRGGLEKVFGETDLEGRMQAYDSRLKTCWDEMKDLDLGHTNDTFIIGRDPNKSEYDQQDYRFGYYSDVFKWRLCLCASKGSIYIKTPPPCWQMYVMDSLNNLMRSLVDENALTYYLARANRNGIAPARNVPGELFTHSVLSLSDVPGRLGRGDPSDKIQAVLPNFHIVIGKFSNMLHIISALAPRTYYWDQKKGVGVWTNL